MTFIWHMSSVQYSKKTIVSGVILKSQPSLKSGSLSMISNAFHTGISYFKQPFANESILIKFDQHIVETLTDSKGRFSISVRDVIENKITILNSSQEKIPFHQNYPVFFKNSNIEQIVISDIDDTIMRSYSQTKVKRLMTTLFYPAHRRKVISSTSKIYHKLDREKCSFFYVSKSEFNLVRLIADFLIDNELPIGPLFLTPYLSLSELINNKKDPSFKLKCISSILDLNEKVPVILIGDDTQADMDVYTQIAEKYGNQISNIYIHQTGRKISNKQKNEWSKLVETGADAIYFTNEEQQLH